jgi:EamA domain-containing membrane protein RarD
MLRNPPAKSHETSALIAGIAAFTTWGLIPVYWKLLKDVPASEILAHRFVWTSVFLIGLLTWRQRWSEVKKTFAHNRPAAGPIPRRFTTTDPSKIMDRTKSCPKVHYSR